MEQWNDPRIPAFNAEYRLLFRERQWARFRFSVWSSILLSKATPWRYAEDEEERRGEKSLRTARRAEKEVGFAKREIAEQEARKTAEKSRRKKAHKANARLGWFRIAFSAIGSSCG
jgi:hypothetical protein